MSSTPPVAPQVAPPFGRQPGRSRRQRAVTWVLIGFSVALVGGCGYGMWKYASADHLGILDNPPVVERAAAACARLERVVDAPPNPGPPSALIRAQDAAISDLIDSMEQLGSKRLHGDEPAEGWIADWRTLRDAREKYAASMGGPGSAATFVVPTADGVPITSRMTQVGVECPVVTTLGAPPVGP